MDKEKDEENKRENKQVKEEVSLSVFIIKNLIRIIIFMGIGWLATIGGFLWYLYQYDYVSQTTVEQQTNDNGNISSIINGNGGGTFGIPENNSN